MADIRLINILPPQTVPSVPTVTQGQTSGTSTPSISNLTPGTVLNGFIINRDASGNPILRTDSGDVTFSSNFFLKIGSEVSVRVEQSGGNTLAHILSVDGQPPEIAEKQSAFAGEPQVIVSDTLASSTPAGQTQYTTTAITLIGTLISSVAPEANSTASPPPVGSTLTFKIVTLTPPATTPPTQAAPAAEPQATSPSANTSSYAIYARASGIPTSQTELNALATANPVGGAAAPPETIIAGAVTAPVSTQPANTTPAIPAATQPTVTQAPAATNSPITATVTPSTAITTPAITAPAAPNSLPTPTQTLVTAFANTPVTSPTITNAPTAAPIIQTTTQTVVPTAQTTPPSPIPAHTATPAPAPATEELPVTLAPGQTITGKVIGNQPSGAALIQTPVGVVRLQPGTFLPTGSTITFTLDEVSPPVDQQVQAENGAPLPPAPITELAGQWTALQQIFGLLTGLQTNTGLDNPAPTTTANPQAATQTSVSPQNISAGLLIFISALRGSDFRNWLGANAVRELTEGGHEALLKKAEGEFMTMSRQFTQAPPNHWQPVFFPVAVEGTLQQVRLFVKRDRKQNEGGQQGQKKEDTRFVVEMDLSQLGEMQVDGFVRRTGKDVQFDLMIRSLSPLPQDVQRDILAIYNNAGQITGYKGNLAFQHVREFPVNPMEDIAGRGDNVMA